MRKIYFLQRGFVRVSFWFPSSLLRLTFGKKPLFQNTSRRRPEQGPNKLRKNAVHRISFCRFVAKTISKRNPNEKRMKQGNRSENWRFDLVIIECFDKISKETIRNPNFTPIEFVPDYLKVLFLFSFENFRKRK